MKAILLVLSGLVAGFWTGKALGMWISNPFYFFAAMIACGLAYGFIIGLVIKK